MTDPNEVTRLCPNCKRPVTRRIEARGRCACGQLLVNLGGRWGTWDNDTLEALCALGDLDAMSDELDQEQGGDEVDP